MNRYTLMAALMTCANTALADPMSDQLAVFETLLGTWDCAGQNAATPQSPAFAFRSGFRIEAVLGGQFVQVTYSEVESTSLPNARDNVEYWEKAGDGFHSTFFNAFGQRGDLASSGPKDGRLVWSGTIDTPNGSLPFEGRMDISEVNSLTVEPTLIFPDGTEFAVASLDCSRGS